MTQATAEGGRCSCARIPPQACAGRPGFRATNPCRIAPCCWAPWPSARAGSPECSKAPTCSRPPRPLVPWASSSNGTAMASGRSMALASAGWPRPTGFSISATPAPAPGCCSACSPAIRSRRFSPATIRCARGRWAGSSRRCRRWARASSHAAAIGCLSRWSAPPSCCRSATPCRSPRPRSSRRCSWRACTRRGAPRWSSRSRRATTRSGCSSHLGAEVEVTDQEDGTRAVSVLGQPELAAATIVVPGDFSSAAFPLVAATLAEGSSVRLEGVGINPLRTGLLDCLEEMGARIRIEPHPEPGGEPIADLLIEAGAARRHRSAARARPAHDRRIPHPGGRRGVRQRQHADAGSGRAQGEGKAIGCAPSPMVCAPAACGRGRDRGPGDSRLAAGRLLEVRASRRTMTIASR